MNNTQTTIQIRIDKKTKKGARKILEEMGLDISGAVKLFLKNVVIEQKIPFEIKTKNGFTPIQEQKIIKDAERALKHGKRYNDVDEVMNAILKEK